MIHISLYWFYPEELSKTSHSCTLQRKFKFFFFNLLIVYNTWYTETETYKQLMTLTRIKRLFYNNSLLITVHMKVSKHLEKISFLFCIILSKCFSF